jgi:hypothetical protein
MNRTLNLYSIFYYNLINILLIILKHFLDLNFECYIYIYIPKSPFKKKKKKTLSLREREI